MRRPSLCLVVVSLATATGCDLSRVVAHNARWLFRTPQPSPRADPPRSDDAALSVLWVGHATTLIQMGDRFLLTDPVFTETVGGFSRRLVMPGLNPQSTPSLAAVLISHRHLDHLSKDSLRQLGEKSGAVICPVGAGRDIPQLGVDVVELGWWRTWESSGVRITAVPVAHSGGRWPGDESRHPRAFTGYVIEHGGQTVFFAGDTAYDANAFVAIAKRFPRIDLALLPIGPMTPARMMRPHHLDPAQALDALRVLRASVMVPIHFQTYLHSFDRIGDCERALDALVASQPDVGARVLRLDAGERRVIVPLPFGGAT